ncbi:hypothetical protein CDAR_413801 [Caerostris darwini]|uniref:Uncharacterized protein n=1 Tax=Caerostris darwini TaxID=1538125 RepID=A0AAV4UE13_9ARAC|nr:hypothetical protein CDAR_413801 [Caerostris darwini]
MNCLRDLLFLPPRLHSKHVFLASRRTIRLSYQNRGRVKNSALRSPIHTLISGRLPYLETFRLRLTNSRLVSLSGSLGSKSWTTAHTHRVGAKLRRFYTIN